MVMAAKHSENLRQSDADEASDGEDDGSVASRSSSESSGNSSSDSSSDSTRCEEGSPPPSLNGDRIRQNARDLLRASPGAPGPRDAAATTRRPDAGGSGGEGSGYRSYQDAPAVTAAPSSFPATAATPPWGAGGDGARQDDAGLGLADVAGLALSCVARCLVEGYRAATSGGHDSGGPEAAPRGHGAYPHVAFSDAGGAPGGGSGEGGARRAEFSDDPPHGYGEAMDRSWSPPGEGPAAAAGGAPPRVAPQRGDWATVPVPSSYQGGRAGR